MNAWPVAMEVVQVLGWVLLHFLWQGAFIGIVYALLSRCLPRGEVRYLLGMLALLSLALCPVLTAWHVAGEVLAGSGPNPVPVAAMFEVAAVTGGPGAAVSWQSVLASVLPWLVLAWSCGVALLSLRVWWQWRRVRALVRAAHAVPVWQERLRSLALRFGLHRGVRVLSSARVLTPTLVGWIRPVILLPLAVSSGFPAEQVEMILAHELAHVRRFDHLANLFQVALETLLFYHPVVHWISRDVRNERELCCDALALRVTGGSRREFATALVELEEFREHHASLTLAASGGVLLERIGQITGADGNRIARQPGRFVGAFSALLIAALLLSLLWRQAELRREASDPSADMRQLLTSQLLPAAIRVPAQTISDLVPVRIGLPPEHIRSLPRARAAHAIEFAPPHKLAIIAPPMQIATTVPPRLMLASSTVPSSAISAPGRVGALTPTHIRQPVYPLAASEQGIEGKVVIEFSLGADGGVRDPQVVAAEPSGIFDNAATRALLGWRFMPPPQADASRRYRQTFTFTLHPRSSGAGREVEAKAGCYMVTGSHICRPRSADGASVGNLH